MRQDSLEGRGRLGNYGELGICVMQTTESTPNIPLVTPDLWLSSTTSILFPPNYDPKQAEKYSAHGQLVWKLKCLWNNTMLRTEGKGKQNPTLCCKSTVLLNAGEIPLLATLAVLMKMHLWYSRCPEITSCQAKEVKSISPTVE